MAKMKRDDEPQSAFNETDSVAPADEAGVGPSESQPPQMDDYGAVRPVEQLQVPQGPMERNVTIVPRTNIPKTRIGGKWYSFTRGKAVQVPPNVAQVLKERDIL